MFLTGCTQHTQQQRFSYARIILGVECRITLYADDEPEARQAATKGFDRILELDAIMSDWRADSELNVLCAKPPREWHAVSPELFGVIERASQISYWSDGAFDVTVGPAVLLWRRARREGVLPDAGMLSAARSAIDWESVELDDDDGAVRLMRNGMRLDLGGIGKGWIGDESVATVTRCGAPSCLVDLGGDIVAGAAPPGQDGWSVRVVSGLGEEPVVIDLAHAALATSGDLEQFVEVDGVRYSHIVDPRTGIGVTARTSASVIAPDGATADALASAACVLGADDLALGLRWPWPDVALRVVTVDGDSGTTVWQSPSWPGR